MTVLLNNWHFMRIFRAVVAVFAFSEAWRTGESLMLVMGGIFALQAIFDIGCCGAAGCAAPPVNKTNVQTQDTAEISYEEVRSR
jgi:hypothetical protein